MLHPVQQKVAALNRQACRLRTTYGLGFGISTVLAAAFLLGLLDYLFRFQDPGIRYLSSAAWLAVLAVTWRRFIDPAWRHRPSDRQVAQRIEEHFPQLQDKLSSAIAFLGQSEHDPLAGSAALRRAVIASATGDIEQLDFQQCLDRRPARRTGIVAAVVGLVVLVVSALDGQASWLAARRLAMPWNSQPWPRRCVLEFVKQPSRIALGSDFEVEVVARHGHLPDVVKLVIWLDGDEQRNSQVASMKFFGDKMVHRLENVRRGFRYRAVGGDDDSMPWLPLEVVEPPHVAALSLRLHPPAYTGWPVETSGENILALEGTRVEVLGRLNKAAASVELQTDQKDAVPCVPVRLAGDGSEFQLPADAEPAWILHESVAYWFVVTDEEGLQGGGERRWNARVVHDTPPTVSLEKPGANTFVTRVAVVSLDGLVKDDLAIHTVELRYRRSDAAEVQEETIELQGGPDAVPRAKSGGLTSRSGAGESRPFHFAWDLAPLQDLAPGAWIEFSVAASDYQPQVGQSTTRRLTVITAEELEDRVAARQAYILGQLAEILYAQREARAQTKSLEIQLDTAGRLNPSDVNQLQAADLSQRQVGKLLADPQDGVQTQITGLLDELQSNRVDSPEISRRMQQLLDVVEQISRQKLPEIQRSLINALKAAGEALNRPPTADLSKAAQPDEALRQPLSGAGTQQDEVISLLEQTLGEMSQWDSYRRFAREFSRLRQQQQQIRQETERIRLDTLGKELNALTAQEKANLKRLAERQIELARQVDKTQSRMAEMQAELSDSDPLAAETLADALELVRRTAVSGQMRESGRDVENNRVGQAVGTQQEIVDHLQEVLDALANHREHELSRRLRKLDEAAEELKQLRDKQQGLNEQLDQAAQLKQPEQRQRELQRLARQQQELAEQSQRLVRRLQRLQSQAPAGLVEQASACQQEAAQASDQDDPAAALEQGHQAEQLLDQAERQIQGERQQAKQDLFQEQMARLEKEVSGLIGRQQASNNATTELEGLRQQQGQFRREQLASVRDLATQQRSLATETGALGDKVREAAAFALGFREATQDMERAARQLDLAETGGAAQPQQRALTRLLQLREALKPDAAGEQKPPDGDPPVQPPSNQPSANAIQRLAELKLLKSLQQELNRRTGELETLRVEQGSLTADQVRELVDLAQQQGRLADLLMNLSPPKEAKPDSEPSSESGSAEAKPDDRGQAL